ncbi:MAG: hypothetical protein HOV81_29680 [Kofleriaceae bacterium]|nr:hypothetical protein [Kofleriaceae bacterium]
MLRSLWLTCVLSVVSATAWAQSAPTTAVSVAPNPAVVDKARSIAAAADQKLAQLSAQRRPLVTRYQQQLAAIDGLKKQKASWRRDRELNTAQANANDTATRLTALDKQIATAQRAVASARKAVVVAIDAEVRAGATGPRATQLAQIRAQLAPATPAPKKIIIPDAEIDPLADPEELERQAAAIAAAEKLLEAQRTGLDTQHKELVLVAELRQAHDRAGELSTRDDDQPHRGAQRGGTREADSLQSPTAGGGAGSTGPAGGQGSGGGGGGEDFGSAVGDKGSTAFESSVVALGEVIDRSTIDGMLRASRSGDPKQRAEAAAAARDAVAKRLELLKKKRAMIEARAKQLRGR